VPARLNNRKEKVVIHRLILHGIYRQIRHVVGPITKAGGDAEKPRNGHLASIHHTAFLDHLDTAKDHYIKWLLASVAEMEEEPCAPSAKTVDTLCTRLQKRARKEDAP
jgi:hypothetical protein